MKRLAAIAAVALVFLVVSPPGMAADATAPRLRAAIAVASDIVTLGDLFEGAGVYADTAVFRSPDLGHAGTVPADVVAHAAEAAGMTGFDRAGIGTVTVTRSARPVAAAEIADLIKSALAGPLATDAGHIDLTFDMPPATVYAAPDAAVPVAVERLARSPSGTRFDAVLRIDQGAAGQEIRVAGTAVAIAEVVTATRPLDRGEIVAESDVAIARVPVRQALPGAAAGPADLVGLAARRAIRPGVPLAAADFAPPNLVERGDTVTIVYRGRGLVLTARGKALDNGAMGAGVSVVNLSSSRILTATVVDRGTVEVGSNAPTGKLALGNMQ